MAMSVRGHWFGFALGILWLISPASADAVESQIQEMIRSRDLGDTRVSVVAVDLDNQHTLVRIDPDEPMIPASNMKLLTSAAALDVLGPDYVFRTELALIDHDDPDLDPSLLVRGDGDPAFGDPVLLDKHDLDFDALLQHWIDAIEETGLSRFKQLIIDDRVFDRDFVHSTWPEDQLNRWYCAQVAGFNFYQNCLDVIPAPASQPGRTPRVELFPAVPFLETSNRATTGDNDAFWIHRRMGTNNLTFRGTVKHRPGRPLQVTVHDPPILFGQILAHRLAEQGIHVDNVLRPDDNQPLHDTRPLHVVQTTLPLILMRVNQNSQNMFAEALLKRMGRAITGAPGSWENGSAAVRLALQRRLGTDTANISVADGSGMSRDNRITARLMVNLLQSLHNDPDKADVFRQSLAHAGESGTLASRMSDLQGDAFAKTGYIRQVSGLSGYLQLPPDDTGHQRTIAFSILCNGFQPPLYNRHMRQLQDDIVLALEDALLPADAN